MTGAAFIKHPEGWCCSNDVIFDVEKDIIFAADGSRVSRQTNTLKIKAIFNGKGVIQKDFLVDCVFKLDDKDILQGFTGRVTGHIKDLTVITLHAKTERTHEILKKIKEEI